jgi:probable F420-dependent oxidoreductase
MPRQKAKARGTKGAFMARVSVGLGLGTFPFDTVCGYWRWIELAETGGIDSIWLNDRVVSTEQTLESLTALAAIAGRTRRLKFGMNVVSLAFREPVLLAKQCATIDVLSEGRLLPAFGIGSPLAPEWNALFVAKAMRGAKADEALYILRKLWTENDVTFEGRHFRLANVSVEPKPVQSELPMWIGGSSVGAIRRTARFGTGWQSTVETPEEVAPLIARIRAAAVEAGRSIDEGHYGVGFPVHFGTEDDPGIAQAMAAYQRLLGDRNPREFVVVGDASAVLARIAAYVAAGASKFILRPLVRGDDAMLSQARRVIEELLPAIHGWNLA